jgi:hypothetical protein
MSCAACRSTSIPTRWWPWWDATGPGAPPKRSLPCRRTGALNAASATPRGTALPRVLRRHDPQQEHAGGLLPGRLLVFSPGSTRMTSANSPISSRSTWPPISRRCRRRRRSPRLSSTWPRSECSLTGLSSARSSPPIRPMRLQVKSDGILPMSPFYFSASCGEHAAVDSSRSHRLPAKRRAARIYQNANFRHAAENMMVHGAGLALAACAQPCRKRHVGAI